MISIPNSLARKSTAAMIDRKTLRLQQRGPSCSDILKRLSAVARLLRLHSTVDSGVDLLRTLMKMPLPMAAPQAPKKPQKPPFTSSDLLFAYTIDAAFSFFGRPF
jgi:hypothetical protein